MEKLTDNEIIKALECCGTYKGKCTDCPAFVKVDRSNCKQVLLGAIEIINRLQAENEKLEHQLETLCIALKLAKAEAYKEFIERLKICLQGDIRYDNKILFECDIDNLLKERVVVDK